LRAKSTSSPFSEILDNKQCINERINVGDRVATTAVLGSAGEAVVTIIAFPEVPVRAVNDPMVVPVVAVALVVVPLDVVVAAVAVAIT